MEQHQRTSSDKTSVKHTVNRRNQFCNFKLKRSFILKFLIFFIFADIKQSSERSDSYFRIDPDTGRSHTSFSTCNTDQFNN
jgi:hypothetical protein